MITLPRTIFLSFPPKKSKENLNPSILLLVWQWLRLLGTFSRNSAQLITEPAHLDRKLSYTGSCLTFTFQRIITPHSCIQAFYGVFPGQIKRIASLAFIINDGAGASRQEVVGFTCGRIGHGGTLYNRSWNTRNSFCELTWVFKEEGSHLFAINWD